MSFRENYATISGIACMGYLLFNAAMVNNITLAQTVEFCPAKQGYVPSSSSEIHTYDPCLSSNTNWNRTFHDQTISTYFAGKNFLSVTSSVALAGAIASIKLNGKEFIASGGHGAALQYILHAHGASECYNPTEAGNKTDDSRPGWNLLPYHGPSSSYLFKLARFGQEIITSSRLAFYVPTGTKSDYNGCIPHYPSGFPYDLGLSPYLLSKSIKVGIENQTGYLKNVISISAQVKVEKPEASPNFDAVLVAYLQNDFNTYFKFNPVTGAAKYLPFNQYVNNPGAGNSTDPVIVSTKDGSYAIGIFVPAAFNTANDEKAIYYLGYNSPGIPNFSSYPFAYQTLQVTYYASNLRPGIMYYRTYLVVGDLERVKSTLMALYNDKELQTN